MWKRHRLRRWPRRFAPRAGFGALHLRAERIGCFPERGYPRVVWVGVRDEAEQLPGLQQAVQVATEGFTAEPKEERFTGHVTLARIKGIKRPEAEALAKAAAGMADRAFGQWTTCRIELMRSESRPRVRGTAASPPSHSGLHRLIWLEMPRAADRLRAAEHNLAAHLTSMSQTSDRLRSEL